MGELVYQPVSAWGTSMRGSIRSRQKCPLCGSRGRYRAHDYGRGQRALRCQCANFHATRFEIRIWWQGRKWEITADENGRRFVDYSHAERALGLINNQIENTLDPNNKGPQFRPEYWIAGKPRNLLWENYLEAYLEREARRLLPEQKATYDAKKARLRHTAWLNGSTIREISSGKLQDFAALPCLKMALAPKTRADLMGELGQLFRHAATREDIDKAPETPSVRVPKKRKRWLSQEQQLAIMEFVPFKHRPIFLFMMDYGVRPAAACALCWDYVDLDKGEFTIGRTFSRRRLIDTTKSLADYGLPIMGWLKSYLNVSTRGIGQTPVFRNLDARNSDRFYSPDFLASLWKNAVAASGQEPIRLYNATKHSLGNQLRRKGVDLHTIASWLGISPEQARSSYVVDDVDFLRRQMEKTVIGGGPKKSGGH